MVESVGQLVAILHENIKREKKARRLAMDALIDAWVENAELRARVQELEASSDLRWKADMRAIKRWQKATGKRLVWPDHTDLLVWLMMRLPETYAPRAEE